MKKIKKVVFILIPSTIILIYFLSCSILYFFEPPYYNAPDLSLSGFSFDLYSKYSASKNKNFFIKQITYTDIVKAETDSRLKYIDDTAIIIADDGASYEDVKLIAENNGAEICGYIADADFYQFYFSNLNYDELLNKCSDIAESSYITAAIPDYFEETPNSINDTNEYMPTIDNYYYDMANIYSTRKYSDIFPTVNIGMIDVPVNYLNNNLNIANKNEYSEYYDLNKYESAEYGFHGTHVAGIMAASEESESPGVCPGANIYSYNGINNSLSYWIASLTDMITRREIKAINISMGYNGFIPISATLNCKNTREYIDNENAFFSAFLNKLSSDYEFIICLAAGNNSGDALYKTRNTFFGYGEKELLNIFSSNSEYCDAEYSFILSAVKDKNIRDHIIIVGSCGGNYEYTSFSNAGKAVDIAAPGENIYSTVGADSYEYSSGTSMAAPFVTATVALLFSIDDNITSEEVKNAIISSATETVSAYGFDYPILNIGNAVHYITDNAQ